ncbi:MAG: hypothetical protein KKH01_02085 [Firmicutes bacterium]|nr:hypothetical protein [Bacillota bacterium]
MNYKLSTYLGSALSICFGVWHFFIPTIFEWYSYMDTNAQELVFAVRATNLFFSLIMVLLGTMNIIIISSKHTSKHTITTILLVNIILWFTRVVAQIIAPQGTINFYMQYGMLIAFMMVLLFYVLAILLYLKLPIEKIIS